MTNLRGQGQKKTASKEDRAFAIDERRGKRRESPALSIRRGCRKKNAVQSGKWPRRKDNSRYGKRGCWTFEKEARSRHARED